jgi:hypothetical protein
MEWGRREPLFATDDMADLHQVVVHNVGKVVSRQVISRLVENLVVKDIRVDNHFATDEIMDVYVDIWFYLETNYILLASSNTSIYLLLAEGEGVDHLLAGAGIVLEVSYFCTFGFELLWGVKGNICVARSEELVHILVVDLAALTLTVWAMVAFAIWSVLADTLVDLNAKPSEGLGDIFFGSRNKACRVGILNTK